MLDKSQKKDSIFHEEYYFSQLLSHLILIYLKEHPDDKLYSVAKGIIFDSTQNENGTNFLYQHYIQIKSRQKVDKAK